MEQLYALGTKTQPGVTYGRFRGEFLTAALLNDERIVLTDAQGITSPHARTLLLEPGGEEMVEREHIVIATRMPNDPLEAVLDEQIRLNRKGYDDSKREFTRWLDARLKRSPGSKFAFDADAVPRAFEGGCDRVFAPEVLAGYGVPEQDVRVFRRRYEARLASGVPIDATWVKANSDEDASGELTPRGAALIWSAAQAVYLTVVPTELGVGLITPDAALPGRLGRLRLLMRPGANLQMRQQEELAIDGSGRSIKNERIAWLMSQMGSVSLERFMALLGVSDRQSYLAARSLYLHEGTAENRERAFDALGTFLDGAARELLTIMERAGEATRAPDDTEVILVGTNGLRLRVGGTEHMMSGVAADPTSIDKGADVVQIVASRSALPLPGLPSTDAASGGAAGLRLVEGGQSPTSGPDSGPHSRERGRRVYAIPFRPAARPLAA